MPAVRARRGSVPPARRVTGWVVSLLLLVLFWPANLGGLFGLTVIAGHSMEPTYTLGQLAVTMRAPSYGVGDVVVYQPADFEAMVVHRLIARQPDGTFTSQGDNNDAIDPWTVAPDQPIGKVVFGLPTCDSRFCQPAFLMRLVPALALSAGAMSLTWGLLSRRAQDAAEARHARPPADTRGQRDLRGSSPRTRSGTRPRHSVSS